MKLLGIFLLFFCTLVTSGATTAATQMPVYFAVLSDDGGNPFLTQYANGQFRPIMSAHAKPQECRDAVVRLLSRFPKDRVLTGVMGDGTQTTITIDSVTEPIGGMGEYLFQARATPKPKEVTLFATAPAGFIRPLRAISITLTPDVSQLLRKRASSLFARALSHHTARGAQGTLVITKLTPVRVERVSGYLAVLAACEIEWRSGTKDDRCSVFFVVRELDRSIVFERFGHPEWAPISDALVATIKPELFFNLGRSNVVYFFGEYSGPWESHGYGIFRFPAMHLVARSY